MKEKNSAITQMLTGERGTFERIPRSDDYNKASNDLIKKIEDFKIQIANNTQLLKKFDELQEASEKANAVSANEIYKEDFSFGLAMGQEVFDK